MSVIPADIIERFPDANHARWGMGSQAYISTAGLRKITQTPGTLGPSNVTHPLYDQDTNDWAKWRAVYESGDKFVERYTKKFSRRETPRDFQNRKDVTPIPAFAKGAINEIKNSIFQRAADTTRKGGPVSYQKAANGELGGVDLKGATMNWFVGHFILPELLTMKKVGVYVDSQPKAETLAGQQNRHPYYYTYKAEDIRSWAYAPVNQAGVTEYTALMLREYDYVLDPNTYLPVGEVEHFRHMFIGSDGFVHVRFYDHADNPIGDEIVLEITRIPFVAFEISDSLLKDAANHQIALLNLESSDISYSLRSNFPFYVEEFDPRENNPALKAAQATFRDLNPGTECPTEISNGEETQVGVMDGRRYPKGMNPPQFINPSSEPLTASMAKQRSLKDDIRLLVHLALSNIQPKMASAESKGVDQQGLESGLSNIGLELERGERQLASYWAMYEGSEEVPTVNYPKQWSLKTAEEVRSEVKDLRSLRDDMPSATLKKELNKRIAGLVVGNAVTAATLTKIENELEAAKGASSDPTTITSDVELGVLGVQTATELRGYPADEQARAEEDHANRLARIASSQSSNPAARGVPDLGGNPGKEAKLEKVGQPGRGEGQ